MPKSSINLEQDNILIISKTTPRGGTIIAESKAHFPCYEARD